MQFCSAKARLLFALPMLCVTLPLLSGCGAKPDATLPVSSAPPAVAPPASPSLIVQADQAFKSHSWDDAITLYTMALDSGLPHGTVSSQGSDAYVRRNISRAHEYKGVEASQTSAYTFAETEFHSALKADSTNLEAKRLLIRTQRAQIHDEKVVQRQRDSQKKMNDAAEARNVSETEDMLNPTHTPDPNQGLENDINRQNKEDADQKLANRLRDVNR